MQKHDRTQTNSCSPGLGQRSMWTMSELSHYETRPCSSSYLIGIPKQFVRPILDSYVQRRRSRRLGKEGWQTSEAKIHRSFAAPGTAGRNRNENTLLWSYGIRLGLRASSHTPLSLESFSNILPRYTSQGWSPETSLPYRLLALRACRYTALEPEIGALRCKIRNEIQWDRRGSPFYTGLLSSTAETWLAWAIHACGFSLTDSNVEIHAGQHNQYRRTEMGLAPFLSRHVARLVHQLGHPAHDRSGTQSSASSTGR